MLIIQITDSDKWISRLSLQYNHLLDFLLRRYGYKRNEMSESDILIVANSLKKLIKYYRN